MTLKDRKEYFKKYNFEHKKERKEYMFNYYNKN